MQMRGVPMALLVLAAWAAQGRPLPTVTDLERLPYAPLQAICHRAPMPLSIDGKLNEPAWTRTAWSEPFVDIRGDRRPPLLTRVKMLWDDRYFYFGAELEEPDIWATLEERDSVIFQDNDFEVFIDPDGDTHAYYELEVNALGTAWDLMLLQPYRDGGRAIDGWDIAGLRVGVDIRGTLNRPGDRDEAWTVELALPWQILREAAPERRAPRDQERWRVNFSRVQWQTMVAQGTYRKRLDPANGKPLPEDNWVWSPQGVINMHVPERWGFVQFSDTPPGGAAPPFVADPNDRTRWALRRLYYRQSAYRATNGRYASELAALDAGSIEAPGFRPELRTSESLYEISTPGTDGSMVHIRQDGRVWVTDRAPGAR
jgi:hypothetical protein